MTPKEENRQKARLAIFGLLMFICGVLASRVINLLADLSSGNEEPAVRAVYSPLSLKEQILKSPFPPGTHFIGLTRQWNFQWERKMLEMAKWTDPPGGDFVKSFDRYGFPNDEDNPLQKPDGEYRIMIFGDSNTEGYCPNAHAFPQLLQKLLIKNGRTNVRVINAGMSASSAFDHILRYENLGIQFDPDLVIFAFTLSNDLIELLPETRPNYLAKEGSQYCEMGPVVMDVTFSPPKELSPSQRIVARTKLREERKKLKVLPGQGFGPADLKYDENFQDRMHAHEGFIESFNKGSLHQGGIQRLYLASLPGLFNELKERLRYCFWKLSRLVGEAPDPPEIQIMLLPSPYDLRPTEIKAIADRVDDYLVSHGMKLEPSEQEVRQAFIGSVQEFLKLRPGAGLVDPGERLASEADIFLTEDFHFSVKANRILAEELLKSVGD
ncbi:MAG: SGNH/GDSL hydrolase family protein [Planctomycetota bacterium]|jgi:lysophospholipase L1-like esterase|nr:SGNH/GDSL hydrolase family protein [Planctomycetota bacterium]MDP7249655.1 SGNH/GDSL hydrolase family protein [Planctomycetota bacterium]